jgi:surface protein
MNNYRNKNIVQKFCVIMVMIIGYTSCITKEELLVARENQNRSDQSNLSNYTPFVSTWRTAGAFESVTLPLRAGYNFNFTVDWGDGTAESIVTSESDTDKTHIYTNPGDYIVTINGILEAWYFNNTGDKSKIISVTDFGSTGWINLESAFHGCNNLTSFAGGDTSLVNNMSGMFLNTTALTILDLTDASFDTSTVTSMASMFHNTSSLTTLNLSGPNFDTSAVTDMRDMFNSSGLITLNLTGSNFDTSAVTDMSYMFHNTRDLATLDLGSANFNTSSVTTMYSMFMDAWSLTTLDLTQPSFDTSAVTDMSYMFLGTYSLTTLDLSGVNFNTSAVTNMQAMFRNTTALTALNLSGHDISSVINSSSTFSNNNAGLVVTCDQGGSPATGTYFTETCF